MKKSGILATIKRALGGETTAPLTNGPTGPMKKGQARSADGAANQGQPAGGKISTAKEQVAAQGREIRGMFEHVIRPEERTLRNYLSADFWINKRREYRRINEKEREDLGVYQVLSEWARPSIE